jgi:cell division protein FtsN
MSRNNHRSDNSQGGFPIFAGILLGIVMGLALAAVIAWLMLKKNTVTPPVIKEAIQAVTPAATPDKTVNTKPAYTNGTAGTAEGKARFEFYKELTDKPDTSASRKLERVNPAIAKPDHPAKTTDSTAQYFLQEGAYTNADDAEKVKVKLALLGMIANVQPANIPDKGVWYRVRLGPYKNSTDMNEALTALKSNGLSAAPIKVQ